MTGERREGSAVLPNVARVGVVVVLSARHDPLYGERHVRNGRFMTYGQQAFVYDFVRTAVRLAVPIQVVIEGVEQCPIAAPLRGVASVVDLERMSEIDMDGAVALFDVVTEKAIAAVPSSVPGLAVVHDAGAIPLDTLAARCDRFFCMSATALRSQAMWFAADKLLLANQGVDVQRFRPASGNRYRSRRPQILVYGRLEGQRGATLQAVVKRLVEARVEVTVLGDGEGFWRIGDEHGGEITLIDHIPCFCIHRVLGAFDVIVSSGRGVMESLACGIPALCAGYEYAGLVTAVNARDNQKVNMTGYGLGQSMDTLVEDVGRALEMDRAVCRQLAEEMFSMESFVNVVVRAAENVRREILESRK